MAVLRASKVFNLPENTLRDRVLGKVDPDTVVMGKVPLFDQFEELIELKFTLFKQFSIYIP